jgi:hypothetical protein
MQATKKVEPIECEIHLQVQLNESAAVRNSGGNRTQTANGPPHKTQAMLAPYDCGAVRIGRQILGGELVEQMVQAVAHMRR